MKDTQETLWTYNWRPVFLHDRAYMPNPAFKPGGKMAPTVQKALDRAKGSWPLESEVTWTINVVPDRMPLIATAIRPYSEVTWAIHRSHRKYGRGGLNVSPFVLFPSRERPSTTLLTLNVTPHPEGIIITQMYPGEKIAPPVCLAKHDERAESIAYWRTHGYVATHSNMIASSVQTTPPQWWTGAD